MSWDDALSLVGQDVKTAKEKIKTLGDCMLYFAASGFERLNGDLRYTSADTEWHFNYSPEATYNQNGGNCGAIASLVCYLLDGDYEDIGIITMLTPHKEGHVINYVVNNGYTCSIDISTYIMSYKGLLILTNLADAKIDEAVNNSLPVYKTHKMAIAYSGRDYLTGDIPTGLVKGNSVYIPSNYDTDIHAIIQNDKSGMVFEKIELSPEDIAAIADMRK